MKASLPSSAASRFPAVTTRSWIASLLAGVLMIPLFSAAAEPVEIDLTDASLEGHLDGEKARIVIQANVGGLSGRREPALYGATLHHTLRVTSGRIFHDFAIRVEAIRGTLREVILPLTGEGLIRNATGESLESWSVRQSSEGQRFLVMRLVPTDATARVFSVRVTAESPLAELPAAISPLALTTDPPTLGNGYILIETPVELEARPVSPTGVVPIDTEFLPTEMAAQNASGVRRQAYRFHGSAYTLPLEVSVADPEAHRVSVANFQLRGDLSGAIAQFLLTGMAHVRDPRGGRLPLLSGGAALSKEVAADGWRIVFENGGYTAVFTNAGEFALSVPFHARITETEHGHAVDFAVAPAALAPVVLHGWEVETALEFSGASRPERSDDAWRAFLPFSGRVNFAWRPARETIEGRLFYAVEAVNQVVVSPGLLRQVSLLDFKVMQGELSRISSRIVGEGEITRVTGDAVLSWSVQPIEDSTDRRLVVQLNQPQREEASIQVHLQQALGAFPTSVDVARLEPEDAIRTGGYLRIVNEGAVRLEVLRADGLSQISPEQFIQTDASQVLLPAQPTQVFAFRFAGAGHQLRIQADNILPEIAVSQVLLYRLGETDLAIDADFELDIREAPVRELVLTVPAGYSMAQVTASELSDYSLAESQPGNPAQLRLIFGVPVSGRQVIALRLERDQPLADSRWVLPRIDVARAKSTRGQIGVVADPGFRLATVASSGLTEVATAFFPRRASGLQLAYRNSEPSWELTLNVERLPQSVQADAFHLFSVGQGIAYGSSLINYMVSGSPVSSLHLELSNEYFNVEFTGKDIRGWQKTERGYDVQLHTPVSGLYALLVTYERPFQARGETLTFTGARPVDAASEQGYTLVISTYEFHVEPANISPSLIPLEPGEVPPEYRLFFDAPILAAYRYNARPFNLALELTPLVQGEVVSQVIDRAALNTRISDEGQVVTEARYFVKNRGSPHLGLRLPPGAELWSVTVDGKSVVPIQNAEGAHLVPLVRQVDPDVVSEVHVKLASRSPHPRRIELNAPVVSSPVLLADWNLEPASGHQLHYRGGTLQPAEGILERSGFASVARLHSSDHRAKATLALLVAVIGAGLVAALGCWMPRAGWRRFSSRHLIAGLLVLASAGFTITSVLHLRELAWASTPEPQPGLHFLAPVQQAGSAWSIRVANHPLESPPLPWGSILIGLAAVGFGIWGLTKDPGPVRRMMLAGSWTLLFWSVLRLPDGGRTFFILLLVFAAWYLLLPAVRRWWETRPEPSAPALPIAAAGSLALLGMLLAFDSRAAGTEPPSPKDTRADQITHEIRVQDGFVTGTAQIRWVAGSGEVLPLLSEPGVLTSSTHPAASAKIVTQERGARRMHVLVAQEDARFDFDLAYQTRATKEHDTQGFVLPVRPGLVNTLQLTLVGADVEVVSPQAVSVESISEGSNTVATLVLAPAEDTWIGWKPRSRDARRERAVFFAEWAHAYLPGPGLVEGRHALQIRPAQGEVAELLVDLPSGLAITDVTGPGLAFWRFDPDARLLRITLKPAQTRPFVVAISSQVNTSPLPFEQALGVLHVRGTAGELGTVGVATGDEVQIDDVTVSQLTPINLEDFPGETIAPLAERVPGLKVRRAYRYVSPESALTLRPSAVEPDVRVVSQQTLSLGEDRTVLAANLEVEVIRAGIFRLSFVLPPELEMESISGPALSHWTEVRSDDTRTITLHLKGKTLGTHPFAVALVGPGARTTNGWVVPRISLREATKQRGQLLIVPEQGLRLQVARRDNAAQIDPAQAGVRQQGALAFRLLQDPWTLALDLERVEPWIEVSSLQHVVFSEAQVKVAANLHYEIENTGLRSLFVRLPARAEGVRFHGEHITDFMPAATNATGTLKDWELKFERRLLGRHAVQATYTLPLPEAAASVLLDGVQARGVNLQRGFITLQPGGRLQVRPEPTSALQTTEWQLIPRALLQNLEAPAAAHTFRVVEPAFELPVQVNRHEVTRLLPARVHGVTLNTVVADDGAALTQVLVELVPGDKRLLHFTLPPDARFWFAFVNQNSVWPWQSTNQWLIPLEKGSQPEERTMVEFFYSSRAGEPGTRTLDLRLVGPRLDLPLENISWNIHLNEKWRLMDWKGSLNLERASVADGPPVLDLESYIRNEARIRQEKTEQAEQFLNLANSLVERGDPQSARRAFQAAYGMSQHDQAFNEDARVQLNNLRLQQALVGLNVRQAKVANETGALRVAPQALLGQEAANYTQAEAKQLIERNSAEENAIQRRLAERLIEQQDAAIATPAAIRANIPQQGRRLTFTRPLEVNTWSELRLDLEMRSSVLAPIWWKPALLVGLFALGIIAAGSRSR